MLWVDTKYINLLSSRLPLFKKREENVWNFRCPVCGDSTKNKFKARGYIHKKKEKFLFYCHNCAASMSLDKFIKLIDPQLHTEYVKENFVESANGAMHSKTIVQQDISRFIQPKFTKYGPLKELKRISQLPSEHGAKKYVEKRKIPHKHHFKLFYTPKFKHFVNTLIPDKFNEESLERDEPRLILPFVDQYGNVFGFQGRSFSKDGVRYITIMLDREKPKLFGLESADLTKQFYVFEGPIDSLFIDNSIAMAGSDFNNASKIVSIDKSKATVVMDNEPRNQQIVERINTLIDDGYRVCIWPYHIEEKDVNDMILSGMKVEDVKLTIDVNTFSGLEAKLKLATWRKN